MVHELKVDLALLDVAPSDTEDCVLGVSAVLREHPCKVSNAGDSVGAGYGVHHVSVAHLSRVID